jgi:peptidoglycan/LPS O-acetylase OafA/YrhL
MIEEKQLNRFAYIDTLRGLAALYVFFYHLALLPNPDLDVPYWAKRFVLSGGAGVTLFFVVSAFTMCHSIRARSDAPNQVYKFYLRRIFRIVPLFYVWIVISLIRDFYFYGTSRSLGQVLLSVFFVFNLIPGKEAGFVWASWTLGVEMLFYLVFPLIFRYVTDYRRALGFFFLSIVVSSIFEYLLVYLQIPDAQRDSYLHFSFITQLPVFACGIFAYYLYEAFIKDKKINRSWGILLLGGSLFLYDALLDGRLNVVLGGLYWQAIAFSGLLLGLSILPWKILVNKLTTFIGLISYSVYLNHTTVIVALTSVYSGIYLLEISTSLKFFLSALISFIIVILTSYISYRIIEEPGMRLGRWLIRKISISRNQASAVSKTETKEA